MQHRKNNYLSKKDAGYEEITKTWKSIFIEQTLQKYEY